MSTFKRKSMFVAVLTGLGALSGTASAVHVNPDGLGQVLIYPYYTVRTAATNIASGQQNTYVSITNTTNSAKAVKVRILEGKNSREVLDFNLFLSANDMWTGAIMPVSSDKTQGAKIITGDKSCTTGVVTAAGIPFSNLAYSGVDAGDATLDRTNEGYIEMMEMGVITNASMLTAITHVNGVAPCTSTVLSDADTAGLANGTVWGLAPPAGGLFGGASLLNPATGVDYSYDAVAIDNWETTIGQGSRSTAITPNITSGSVLSSDVFSGATHKTASWTTGRDAVSAAMMRNQVINEYVLDDATLSGTDWVVTFPTKRFYVDPGSGSAARGLFNANFGATGSCDNVSLTVYDREEQTFTVTSGGFSPTAPGAPTQICWEANVLTFYSGTTAPTTSSILGSTNMKAVSTNQNKRFQNGWMSMGFNATANVLTPTSSGTLANNVYSVDAPRQVMYGLPVVGFMVQDFVNSTIVTGTGAAPGAAYGGNFAHKYTRSIR